MGDVPMTQYLIMSRSLTRAQRAARLLERSGISASVVKAPQGLSSKGCGYAVSVRRRFLEAAVLLRRYELLDGKLFQRDEDGGYREVTA